MKALRHVSFLAVIFLVLNSPALATPIYSLTFQNVTFSVDVTDTNSFALRIQNALNANGDWTDAVSIKSFAFKDIGDLGGGSETGLGTWTYHHDELNNSGNCSGSGTGNDRKHCFVASSALALTNDMLWTIDFGTGAFSFASGGPHLKVKFLDAAGNKEGSLLSQSLPLQTTAPPQQIPVPEPPTGILVLSGLGLMKLVLFRRRDLKQHPSAHS